MKVMVVSNRYLSVIKLMSKFITMLSLLPNTSFKNADNLNEINTITMAEAKLMAMSFKEIGFGFQKASDKVFALLKFGFFSTSSV